MFDSIKRAFRPQLLKILVEVGSIVFAVMLALFANEWREGQNKKRLVDSVLQNIRIEITANQAELQRVLPYHMMLQDTLSTLLTSGDSLTLADLSFWRGAQSPKVRDAAYQAAIVSGAFADIEFTAISTLSETYTAQKKMEKLFETYLSASLNSDFTNAQRWAQLIQIMAYDTGYAEQELIEFYSRSLAVLESLGVD